jgi:tetratricopeptide (TPR) repeat protein
MLFLLAFVVVGAAATQVVSYFLNSSQLAADKNTLDVAAQAQASGDYTKAIEAFKNVKPSSLAKADVKQLLELADAHVSGQDGQTARKILAQASSMNLSAEQDARIHALQAAIATQTGDIKQATVELEASLKKSEIFSTLHNLAVAKMKLKQLSEAEPLLLKAIEVARKTPGLDVGVTALALFETAYDLDRKDAEASVTQNGSPATPSIDATNAPPAAPAFKMRRLESIATILDASLATSQLKEKLYLATSVTRFVLGQREAFQLAALELIDNPSPSGDAKTKHQLDDSLATWQNLVRFCSDVYKQPKSGEFAAAFYSACLLRSHGAKEALPFAKYANSIRPQDGLYAGLAANLLIELKQPDEARKIMVRDGKLVQGSKLAAVALKSLGIDAQSPAPPGRANSAPPTPPNENAALATGTTPTSVAPVTGVPQNTLQIAPQNPATTPHTQ